MCGFPSTGSGLVTAPRGEAAEGSALCGPGMSPQRLVHCPPDRGGRDGIDAHGMPCGGHAGRRGTQALAGKRGVGQETWVVCG